MGRAVGAGSFSYLYPASSTLGFRFTGSVVPAGLEGFLDGKPTFEKVGYDRASLRDFGKGRGAGMRRPRRLGHRQNPLPQAHFQFSSKL